jgi:translation initiation factor 2B subunit (eIF-2B alpha/beta/delta family)
MEDLRGELERERRLRVSLEAALRDITTLLEEERDRRRVAEERADAVIAELELASRAHSVDPQRRRRRGVRRVVRRISGRR